MKAFLIILVCGLTFSAANVVVLFVVARFMARTKWPEPLVTLEQANTEAGERAAATTRRNGIACPECGRELVDDLTRGVMMSYPAQIATHCECGYRGSRVI